MVINEVHTFFNSLPRAKFEKTIKVKRAERTELCVANEGWYFEKAWTKKTDYKSEDSAEQIFLIFLLKPLYLAWKLLYRGVRALFQLVSKYSTQLFTWEFW